MAERRLATRRRKNFAADIGVTCDPDHLPKPGALPGIVACHVRAFGTLGDEWQRRIAGSPGRYRSY